MLTEKEKFFWAKIFMPCFGRYDCLINEANPMYKHMIKAWKRNKKVSDICPVIKKCEEEKTRLPKGIR